MGILWLCSSLFNLNGPQAGKNETERIQFKFKTLGRGNPQSAKHLNASVFWDMRTFCVDQVREGVYGFGVGGKKKAQAEREKMVQQQAKKIKNLNSMVLYSNRDRIAIALKREINRVVMYYEYQISLSTLWVVKWLKQFVVKCLYLHFTTFIGIIFD
ncbi:hypothetical protein DVH24_042209 [Malus domestica]|uniref:Uncharacterized protein n=1 Tax=Malus domestica TaxID=3750 RepID=A0A498IXT1_MALDO|nr:hypothetical protein DVH24_042209 [Malus domestica]